MSSQFDGMTPEGFDPFLRNNEAKIWVPPDQMMVLLQALGYIGGAAQIAQSLGKVETHRDMMYRLEELNILLGKPLVVGWTGLHPADWPEDSDQKNNDEELDNE